MGERELVTAAEAVTLIVRDLYSLTTIENELARDPHLASKNTKRGYRYDLTAFEAWRQQPAMTEVLVEEYAAHLQDEGKSPRTINRILAAIRWWCRRVGKLVMDVALPEDDGQRKAWLAERREIVEQSQRVASIRDVRGDVGQGDPNAPTLEQDSDVGRRITDGELRALLQTCINAQSASGIRDAAIIALASVTGPRRAELAALRRASYQDTDNNAEEAWVTYRGKGRKVRSLKVFNGAWYYLTDWLAIRGDDAGPLFYAIRKGGHVQQGKGLSGEALAQMLAKRAKQAGLVDSEGKPTLTWHDFRRSFASALLSQGNDLATVQKLMGHVSPATTSIYDRRGVVERNRALQGLHLPYLDAEK